MLTDMLRDDVTDLTIVKRHNGDKVFEHQVHNTDHLNPVIARFNSYSQAYEFVFEDFAG